MEPLHPVEHPEGIGLLETLAIYLCTLAGFFGIIRVLTSISEDQVTQAVKNLEAWVGWFIHWLEYFNG